MNEGRDMIERKEEWLGVKTSLYILDNYAGKHVCNSVNGDNNKRKQVSFICFSDGGGARFTVSYNLLVQVNSPNAETLTLLQVK
jgi:hypothetical protein